MTSRDLTKEQLAFLEECNLEFSERYTDSDLEYKKIYDLGIPPPPIMYPWHGKLAFNNRGRGGRHNDYRNNRNRHYRNDDRNRDYGYRSHGEETGGSYNSHQRERYSNSNDDNNRDFRQRGRYRPY